MYMVLRPSELNHFLPVAQVPQNSAYPCFMIEELMNEARASLCTYFNLLDKSELFCARKDTYRFFFDIVQVRKANGFSFHLTGGVPLTMFKSEGCL